MSTSNTGMNQMVVGTGNISTATGFTTGSTASLDTGAICSRFAVAITSSATLTGANTLHVEGSLDNTNWFFIASDSGTVTAGYTAAGVTRTIANNTANYRAFRYLRVSYGTVASDQVTVTGSITGGSLTISRAGAS